MTENVPGTDLPDRPRQAATAVGDSPAALPAHAGTTSAQRSRRAAGDRSGVWLGYAAAGLGVLAAAAGVVSFSAQYRMVDAARRLPIVAGLEAAIPDTAALIFACLGIALALRGRRAVRARVLNLTAVATSVFMNAIAATGGWRSLAIWVLPPVAYALASDTLIGVVRAWTIASHTTLRRPLTADEPTPLAAVGGLFLWLLRLALAPVSTLRGFRQWVLTEIPTAPACPDRRLSRPVTDIGPGAPYSLPGPLAPRHRAGTKTAAFLTLAAKSHGSLSAIPLSKVSRISAELAPLAGLNTRAARTALRRAVIAAQNGYHQ